MTSTVTFHVGDVRDVPAAMPDDCVDLLVTSPPFIALRSYLPADHPDKDREIGSEPTPAAFLDTMLILTADWRRVVTATGSIAVEIGDTYAGSGGAGGDYNPGGMRVGQNEFDGSGRRIRTDTKFAKVDNGMPGDGITNLNGKVQPGGHGWPLAKSLCGTPTMYAWSLAYGRNLLTGAASPAGQWRIRNLLTWTRPNPPVGALGDKFRPATSFVTVACTAQNRWFDLDAVRGGDAETPRLTRVGTASASKGVSGGDSGNPDKLRISHNPAGAPPLDWWDANDEIEAWQPLHRLSTRPYTGAHYAAFPPALPERLIKAMCPMDVCRVCGEPRRRITQTETVDRVCGNNTKGADARQHRFAERTTTTTTTIGWTDCGHDDYRPGIVLDPFGGSGTTALAAAMAGRDCVLIDIDRRNVALARQRLADAMRIVSEHDDGNTVTWTVDPAMPGLKDQHPDQLSLLDQEIA